MATPGPELYSKQVSDFIKQAPDSTSMYNFAFGTLPSSNFSKTDPTKQLLLGQTPLPGSREFIDIQRIPKNPGGAPRQCFDACGNAQNLSTLIDTVQQSRVMSDPVNRGLLYSLFASAQDFDYGISNLDIYKNPYSCKEIRAKNSDGTQNGDGRYVLNSDLPANSPSTPKSPSTSNGPSTSKSPSTSNGPSTSKSPSIESFESQYPKIYEKNPLYDPIVWFYFGSIGVILCFMTIRAGSRS
jgi:hypothetical protein